MTDTDIDYDAPVTRRRVDEWATMIIGAVCGVGGSIITTIEPSANIWGMGLLLIGLMAISMSEAIGKNGWNRAFYRRLGVEVPTNE